MSRSLAVDELFKVDESRVVYVYFDYPSNRTQTGTNVMASLLKQLLSQLEDIPSDIESSYNESKHIRPSRDTLVRYLTLCSRKFSKLYAVFDAIDESSEVNQNEILALFADLQKLGYRILVSGRPGSAFSKLECGLTDPHVFEIRADDSDLKQYVVSRVKEGIIQKKCLKLMEKVDGT
jgi:hypothetical protein